ncbi:MAG: hypothetical protein IPI14_12700 [Polaromonas sp.]|nr:hypothetical protein [Polaromonas sp.]
MTTWLAGPVTAEHPDSDKQRIAAAVDFWTNDWVHGRTDTPIVRQDCSPDFSATDFENGADACAGALGGLV